MTEQTPRYAAIDLGTNTLNFLIAEKRNNKIVPIFENFQIIRLGEGIASTGKITPSAIERCISAFKLIRVELNKFNARYVKCAATSALRDAKNGNKIKAMIENQFNIPIHIITGKEEANYVLSATKHEFKLMDRKVIVFDIGGGSSEITIMQNGKCFIQKSLNIGTVRGTETFIKSDPPDSNEINGLQSEINRHLSVFNTEKVDMGIGIAGTVTTLCAIINEIEPYDGKKVHKSILHLKDIASCEKKLASCSLEMRKKIKGLEPERAEVLPAGAVITRMICEKFGLKKIYVSDRGLRWGLLYKLFEN